MNIRGKIGRYDTILVSRFAENLRAKYSNMYLQKTFIIIFFNERIIKK